MSNYKNLTDKQLRIILTNLQNVFEDENIDIDYDNDIFEPDVLSSFDSVLKYFGIELYNEEDYTYFIGLCRLNKNPEGNIIRPKLETYEVIHEEEVVEYKTYNYATRINSYIPLNRNNVYSMGSNDLYYYYEGTVINESNDDSSEIRDDSIVSVEKLKRFD
jgi:hypothetical protein